MISAKNSVLQVFAGAAFFSPTFSVLHKIPVLHFSPLHFWSCTFSPTFSHTDFWSVKLDIIGPAFSDRHFQRPRSVMCTRIRTLIQNS